MSIILFNFAPDEGEIEKDNKQIRFAKRKCQLCYNLPMGEGAGAGCLRVVLPLPPGVNNLYASVNGRRVLSTEGKRFKERVKSQVDELLFAGDLPDGLLERLRSCYLSLFIDFFFTSPMKRDLDGGLKITQDALCEALGINDNRVVDIHLVKRLDPLHPRVEVQLEAIRQEDWQFDEEYYVVGADEP